MTIGEITKLEPHLATVSLEGGARLVYFVPTHQSVVHGRTFQVGQMVSLRFSRDNSRVVSVIPA